MRLILALLIALPLVAQDKPAEAKPAETKPADAKPADAKPAESPAPTPPAEQNISGSFDFGYRVVSSAGSFDSYRSIINLGEGPKLFGWDFAIQDPKKKYFDRIDTQGLGWGGDPYTTARLHARKM